MRPLRAEDGAAPIELVAGLGWLVLPMALLVLSVPAWAEVQSMGRTAAREAARSVVVAPDPGSAAALATGEVAAATVAANHGRSLVSPPVFTIGSARVTAGGATRTQEAVTAQVTVRMPALAIPFVGEWAAFDWTVEHTEPIDLYRSRP